MYFSRIEQAVDKIGHRFDTMFLKKVKVQQIEDLQPWFQNVNCEVRVPTRMTSILMGFQVAALIFYVVSPFILFLSLVSTASRGGKNPGEGIILATCISVPASVLYFLITYKKIGLSIVKSWRRTRRFARDPKPPLRDGRRPVLLLRSFFTDLDGNLERTDQRTPEEFLVEALDTIGPVIAAGRPGEEGLPLLGATRIYLDQDWDKSILELMRISSIVVIDAGNTASLAWEMECVRNLVNPRRVLISLLTKQEFADHKTEILEPKRPFALFYKGFSSTFARSFGKSMPEFDSDTVMICFDDGWNPHPIKLSSRTQDNTKPATYQGSDKLLRVLDSFFSNLDNVNRQSAR